MESFIQILIMSADTFSGLVSVFFASVADGIGFVADAVGFVAGGDIVPLAIAAAVTTYTDIPEEILTAARRWHGKIDEQYSNIENVIVTIQAHPA